MARFEQANHTVASTCTFYPDYRDPQQSSQLVITGYIERMWNPFCSSVFSAMHNAYKNSWACIIILNRQLNNNVSKYNLFSSEVKQITTQFPMITALTTKKAWNLCTYMPCRSLPKFCSITILISWYLHGVAWVIKNNVNIKVNIYDRAPTIRWVEVIVNLILQAG